jgi:hypothetical protein
MNAEHPAAADRSSQIIDAVLRGVAAVRWSPEDVRDLLVRVLAVSGLDYDQRVELLGGMFVTEAVRPYWVAGHSADDAHSLLWARDAEIADIVETLAPVLLGRAEARDEAQSAVDEVTSLLGNGSA